MNILVFDLFRYLYDNISDMVKAPLEAFTDTVWGSPIRRDKINRYQAPVLTWVLQHFIVYFIHLLRKYVYFSIYGEQSFSKYFLSSIHDHLFIINFVFVFKFSSLSATAGQNCILKMAPPACSIYVFCKVCFIN